MKATITGQIHVQHGPENECLREQMGFVCQGPAVLIRESTKTPNKAKAAQVSICWAFHLSLVQAT